MLPLVLVVLFCALLAGTAFAGHLPRTTYIGWVGKSVVAQKDVVYVGSNAWNGKIFSHTQDGTAIGTIGWTYWTHRELCGSTILDNYVHSGYAAYVAYLTLVWILFLHVVVFDMDTCWAIMSLRT